LRKEEYKIVIHVGLHKTGTTFLQKEVFQRLEGVEYFGNGALCGVIRPENLMVFKKDKINVISHERFSGMPFLPNSFDSRFIIALRLKDLFPNAKIIVCTREDKEEWLLSLWKEYVTGKTNGTLPYLKWEKQLNKKYLDQQRYVNFLRSLFQEVLVFDYSKFNSSNEKVIEEICKFIGVETPTIGIKGRNVSLTDTQTEKIRKLNVFLSLFPPFLSKRLDRLKWKIMIRLKNL
jgi:hypothetical protein